ncbi:MAG: hypothetical protein QM762_04345 [Chryseolinea sp.]
MNLTYKKDDGSVQFATINSDTSNLIVQRFLHSRFIVKSDDELYDAISGYPYVDKRLLKDNHTVISVAGNLYKMSTRHKPRGKLKRKLNFVAQQPDLYAVNVLRGRAAYDKYGIIGMNGVIEVYRKN